MERERGMEGKREGGTQEETGSGREREKERGGAPSLKVIPAHNSLQRDVKHPLERMSAKISLQRGNRKRTLQCLLRPH